MDGGNQQRDHFLELVKPELPRLQAFCRKLTGNSVSGDDLLQDALYDALKGFSKLRNGGAFRSWLYRIVINRYRTTVRRLSRETSLTVPLSGDVVDSTVDKEEYAIRAARERLSVAMARLSALDRALVTLHELEGWSFAELAEILGKSEGSLRTRLSRAKKKMRKALMQYLGRDDGEVTKSGVTRTCAVAKQDES